MKKVFVGLLLAMSMQAMADDYGYLTFTKGDGSARSLAVDGLTITFADGKATVQNATESESFTLSDLAKMFFSVDEETTMGIISIDFILSDSLLYSFPVLKAMQSRIYRMSRSP